MMKLRAHLTTLGFSVVVKVGGHYMSHQISTAIEVNRLPPEPEGTFLRHSRLSRGAQHALGSGTRRFV